MACISLIGEQARTHARQAKWRMESIIGIVVVVLVTVDCVVGDR